MKLATSTVDFSFLPTAEERVRHVADAGFRFIDMSFYDKKDVDPFMGNDWREKALALREYAEGLGCRFVQAHSPGGNPLNPAETGWLVESTIRTVEVCEILGIPCTVAHAGFLPGIDRDEYCRRNRAFYERLFPAMEQCGVQVLVENSTRANMGEMYYFNDGADLRAFLDWVDHPLLNACWDTGHANCEGHQYADITALGSRLTAVHINDNRGKMDEHLPPFCGNLSLDEVMDGLRAIDFPGVFTFECSSLLIHSGGWPVSKKPYGKSNALQEPPLFLHDMVERMLYETGRYVLETCGYSVE